MGLFSSTSLALCLLTACFAHCGLAEGGVQQGSGWIPGSHVEQDSSPQIPAAALIIGALLAAAVVVLVISGCAQSKADEQHQSTTQPASTGAPSAAATAAPPRASTPARTAEAQPPTAPAAAAAPVSPKPPPAKPQTPTATPSKPMARAPAVLPAASLTARIPSNPGTPGESMMSDGPLVSVAPGQPANPIDLPDPANGANGKVSPPPKPAGAAAYESDDEGEVDPEQRFDKVTQSVKGHINNNSARRVLQEQSLLKAAVEHLVVPGAGSPAGGSAAGLPDDAAAGAGPAAAAAAAGPAAAPVAQPGPAAAAAPARPDVPKMVLPAADLTVAQPQAAPAKQMPQMPVLQPQPGAGAALNTGPLSGTPYAGPIDLEIDLTKGDLKVDYSTRGLLGQGGFAAVYKGRYKGHRVAVKMIKKATGTNLADLQEDINALIHELNILRQVNHPNIVTLHGGCLKPPHIFLVEERMEGTLDFYVHTVRKRDPLTVREMVYFALDIASGLSYLHPRIVHRDLKLANVLLSREGRCKISDFGLARTKLKEYLSTKNLDAGTTAYIAPECFMSMDNPDLEDLRRSVTDKTDIYALGIMMWEMLTGKRPWQGLKPLLVAYQVAYRSLRPPVFELGPRCPAKLRQLIEDCWCQEPKRRPSSQQAVDRLLAILNELPPELDQQQLLLQQQQQQQQLAMLAAAAAAPPRQPQYQPPPVPQHLLLPHERAAAAAAAAAAAGVAMPQQRAGGSGAVVSPADVRLG